ncbi:HlyD family efflux transporter periplasmic adaptor subunit [Stenomitos frigidus]|uniref:HlyD family efflux transporter periplasmic adaptor subunit n=1 Tax=Stenomitos frigidus TaxID=1886765 RepID=UPI0030DB5E4B
MLDQPPSSLPQRFILGGVVFCLAFGAWAWLGQMNEVGHARGKLVPQGEAYKINPLIEGKVTQLAVNEGQNVKAGQLLVALDGQIAANDVERLEQVLAGYRVEVSQKQTLLEKIRLEAKTRAAIAAANIQAQEVSIAQANANAKTASELVTQYQQDIVEYQERLQRFGPMVTAGAISREQLFEVEQSLRDRQSTTIKSRGDLQQNLAEAERLQAGLTQKHAEGRKDQLASQQQGHELEAQITDLNTKIADTQTSLSSAQSRLKQYSFYAPVDGIVSSLNIKRTGEVVQIGQTIAEIGPQHAPLVLQASLPNQEAGFVKPGMSVQVKVDAYPYQDYGIISGRVVSTSPDSKSDKNLGEVYRIEVALDRDYVSTPQQMIKFKPGQTATAEIVIRDRHIIDILLDPIRKLQKGGINL